MGLLDFLFPSKKRRKKASKKKVSKKPAKSKSSSKGLKHFAVFDGDTDKFYQFVSGKTENQAFNFWASTHPVEAETARIVSKKRWESGT